MEDYIKPIIIKGNTPEEQLQSIGEDIKDFNPIKGNPNMLISKDQKKLVVIELSDDEEWKDHTDIKQIEKIILLNSVTEIGDHAFERCTALQHIIIPKSVTKIGKYALGGCTSLQYIVIPDSVNTICDCAFADCTSLQKIVIPDWIKEISEYAFEGCRIEIQEFISTDLAEELYTRERLRLMGENFDDYEPVTIKYPNTLLSKDLKKLIVLDNIKTFYDSIISRIDYSKDKLEKVILGDSVTEIDDDAFRGCTSLHEIVIPNSVTKIGDDAFMDCTSLYEIVIPNSVTKIGNGAFYGCKSLEEIVIPNSVTEIGDDAFYKCMLLDEVIIPDSVTYIGPGAFHVCTFLRRIVLPKSLAVDETDIIDDVTCVVVRKD